MTPELAYFVKINIAIALFYAFYRLFFCKDTFFRWRRIALLCFFAVSLLYPLLNIQDWIKTHEPMVAMADLYATAILPELTITPQETHINWEEWIAVILKFSYWGGVSILACRFLFQLGSIIQLHFKCPKQIVEGTRVHILNKKTGPFSFFHWIYIHPESHTESEISEIITHEATHARQNHSVDVIISELMCILCWFNPFIWLMKREVRGNLEYMADHKVLETGHDSKSYQYHLLGLAHHKAAAHLSNSFNVLPLKSRIKMMNKQRTKKIGRTKYLMFLPLAALLMIVSNIEIVARTTKDIISQLPISSDRDVATLQDKKSTTTSKTKAPTPPPFPSSDQKEKVFEIVKEMPQFPGGMKALMDYIATNVRYPAESHASGIQGRVIVQFTVKKDGNIADARILSGVDPHLDKESLRVISEMPKWTPGKEKGEAVNVRFSVPVMFKLTGSELPKAEEIKELSEIVVVGYGNDEAPDNEPPMTLVDQMPGFPGGQTALFQYIARNVKYPTMAQKNKEQGKAILKMVIGKDGNISNIRIIKGISPSVDAEVVRVISNMPKWEPGMHQGKAVSVEYTIPIMFRLQ